MKKGFESEVFDSQSVFRQLMNATAFPGTIRQAPVVPETPEGLHPATGAVLLTLMDFETPFWADDACPEACIEWIGFHTGAPYTTDRKKAVFAICTERNTLDEMDAFSRGRPESPHLSATVIIQTKELAPEGGIRLSGPGISKTHGIGIDGITKTFIENRDRLNAGYPLGVDMIFVAGENFTSIPRTSRLEID